MRSNFAPFIIGMATVASVISWHDVRHAAAQPPAPDGGRPSAESAAGTTGKVVETMNSGGYTYVQVDDGSKKIWAAAPQFTVALGDRVVVPNGMPMRDFYSKTLERTFDVVYFVAAIQVVSGQAEKDQLAAAHGASGHGGGAAMGTTAAVDLANIKKADGGQTVAELFTNRAALVGKDVVVRGRVVKVTTAVMGKNWLHVQDGTGGAGTNDLTVTTNVDATTGNTVLVRGKLATDKDFGFGYHYDLLIEDATVKVE